MPNEEAEQTTADGDIQSIKEATQSLAYQLWLEKRDTMEGVDWLVDGDLMAQLDELSKSDILRIKQLLANHVIGTPSGKPHMTAGSA